MNNIWFTSDTHFDHAKVIQYSKRPFIGVEEMNEYLIEMWNTSVKEKDTVWHLGDFTLCKTPEKFWNRLNGRINLVLGNHDEKYKNKYKNLVHEFCVQTHYFRLLELRIWLSHYAHRTWPKSGKGSLHLFGHSHGDIPGIGRSMDVGVDALGFKLISLDEVVSRLGNLPTTPHHTELYTDL